MSMHMLQPAVLAQHSLAADLWWKRQPLHPWLPRGQAHQGRGCAPASGRHRPVPHAHVPHTGGPKRSRPRHREGRAAGPCAGTAPVPRELPLCFPEQPRGLAMLAVTSAHLRVHGGWSRRSTSMTSDLGSTAICGALMGTITTRQPQLVKSHTCKAC